MSNPWLALPKGTDAAAKSRAVADAHARFLTDDQAPDASASLRDHVLRSWRRSRDAGVDPERALAPTIEDEAVLQERRAAHPLNDVMSIVRKLLVADAADSDLLVVVADEFGRLLWVEGSRPLADKAEAMNFVPGALWSEEHVGTNAPGTALALDHAIQIFAHEHYSRIVQPWSCSAAPIHDPQSGHRLGVLDVTGGEVVAAPQSLALVQAAVAAIENELALRWLRNGGETMGARAGTPDLRVLGADHGQLAVDGQQRTLSVRHTEIVLLLALSRRGLTGDELSVLLREDDGAGVTIRAELSRLRSALPELRLASRPYRLGRPLTTDVDLVRAALLRGDVDVALDHYPGPVLPHSSAPGVADVRDELAHHVRTAVLAQSSLTTSLRFAQSEHGRLDLGAWQSVSALARHGSVEAQLAQGRLGWLEQRLGS